MEKTIKYLENGEYHYATVKDVGDLAKLKTDSKDDLVTAINELFITGGEGPKKPDGYDGLVDNVADAIQKQQQMTDTITNMQQSAQLSDAEMEHMKQVQEELRQEYLKAIKELNEAVEKAKDDAADLDKKTNDMQDKIDETFADVNKEVSDVHKQLDAEAKGLHKDLDETKTNLKATRKDLLNSTQEYGQVHSEVKELQDKFNRRVWSTDLGPVREQVSKNSTEVQQTKDELKRKADQSNLDLVTNSVEDLSTQVKQNASGLEVAVKRDELGGDVSRLLGDKTNLLLGTRSFSGEDNWRNRDKVTIEPGYYKGMKTAAVQVTDASIYQPYRVKANTAYTFSFFGKEDRDNPKATLVIKPIDAQNVNVDGGEQQVHITTEWQRFAVTFSVDQECEISIQIIQGPEATNNILHLAGLKLQYGQNDTPWEPNEADVAENIEHTESQFNVYSDQIAGIVKKQEKMGDTERQLDTRITETAKGLEQTSKDIQVADGKINEFNGKLESTAQGLKTEYEKYTNEAVGQISDSSLNLIHNSAFSNQDDQFESWQNISAKATVREDNNNLHWVELTQSGQGTDNPIGVTSNYFIVKQGKVTVAVDVKLGDKANLDSQNILLLELYDENKKRVDFTDVSVSQLGLSMSVLNDHSVHRGLYRLGIDRKDVKYMTVKAILHRNGDLWLTNFSARLSSIDDGGYTPNPDDVNHQILKMNTKIEEDAEHIALKANSVDVTRDIGEAIKENNGGGVNLLKKSAGPFQPSYPVIDNAIYSDSEIEMINDQTYVVSAKTNGVFSNAHLPGTESDRCVLWLYNTDSQVYQIISDANTAQGTTFTWQHPTGTYSLRVNAYHPAPNPIKAWDVKIERGSVATPWTPAPEDTSAEIKSAKDAAIKVASDQIDIHVNELSTQFDDKLNKRVNEVKTASEKFTSDGIEQTVKKITDVKNQVDGVNDKVNNLKVGGRNLVRNTGTDIVVDATSANASNWTFARLRLTEQPKQGDLITVSAEGTLTGTGTLDKYRVVLFDMNNSTPRSQAQYLKAGKRDSVTLSLDNLDGYGDTILLIYAGEAGETKGKKNTVHHLKVEFGNVATDWTPAPEDINQKIDTQTLDSANIDEMKTQGHYFVKSLTGNPLGSGWVYVDVIGNNSDRIRQDVYQDNGNKHMYRRLFGTAWSGWEQGAYLSDVNAVKTEVTASVKNLGDRVTTEVNSVTTKINNVDNNVQNQFANAVELIQKSDFSDGSKGNWTVQAVVSATNPAPPAELGVSGMKVLQTNVRDSYEDVWHSVTPGEKFNIDFWCAPSGAFISCLGLVFYDANKKLVPNNQWLGVGTDHSGQWKHYTGEITAPAYAAFARPWFQMEKPADNTVNTAWLAKPHIKRQDSRVADAIKQLNTKWDVANGQIQGKVTATDVNNILNGKGYATQSWAQTMFTMKSDAITLQAVRANITDGIQNQVNDAKSQINSANGRIDETNEKIDKAKIGEINLAVGTNRGKTGWTVSPGNGQSTMDDSWVNDVMGVIFNNTKKSTSWWVVQYPFDMGRLKPNTFYTISFDIQTDIKTNGNGYLAFARGDSSGSPFVNSPSLKFITEPGATTHVVCKAKTKGSIENNGQAFYLNSNSLGQANWVKIFNLMIVEGTQSIAWAAAPEDEDVKQKGINLLKSTAYWSPGDWNIRLTDGSWVDDNWIDGLGHKAYGRKNGAWNGLGQTVYVTPGIYTWSAQIYVDNFADNDFVQVYMGDSQYNGTAQTISIRVPQLRKSDSDKWVNYSATFFVKNAGNLCVRPELNNAHGEVHVGSQKLEHGMVATPWTPAPTDDNTQTITLDSANIDNMKAQGHYFVKNLTGNPIPGWVYVDVTGNGNDRIKQDVYQDNGSHHKYRRWVGSWTEWVDDVNKDNILSQINISPEKIRLLSNKIEIDGNTFIHGTLNVPTVKLQGKSGSIDLSGDTGLRINNTDGTTLDLNSNGINLAYKREFKMDINSSHLALMQRNAATSQTDPVTIGIFKGGYMKGDDTRAFMINYNPGDPNDVQKRGADLMALGYTDPNNIGSSPSQMWFVPRDFTSKNGRKYRKGMYFWDDITIPANQNYQKIYFGETQQANAGAWDPLMLIPLHFQNATQSDIHQPAITVGYDEKTRSNSGIGFLWDSVKLYGKVDLTDASFWAKDAEDVVHFGWVSWSDYFGGAKEPAFYRAIGNNGASAGIVFARKSLVLFGTSDQHGGNWRRYYGDENAWHGDYVN